MSAGSETVSGKTLRYERHPSGVADIAPETRRKRRVGIFLISRPIGMNAESLSRGSTGTVSGTKNPGLN